MKNTLKKLLALMLVLCMAVAVLVACTDPAETTGGKDNETTTPSGNDGGTDDTTVTTDKGTAPNLPSGGDSVIPETESTEKADPLPEGDPEKDPSGVDIF